MQKDLRIFGMLLVFCVLLVVPRLCSAQSNPYKMVPGMPFTYFDLEDVNRQRWVSTYLQGKPLIILTGHRHQKYEILKWAETLKRDFWLPGAIHLLWVVNTSKFPWSTSRRTVTDQWRHFGPPIPLLLDWHGVVGRSLRVNYQLPNIIGIDAGGRLAFHDIGIFHPVSYGSVAQKLAALIGMPPGTLKPVTPTPSDPAFSDMVIPPLSKGKKGDSN
jgi:hypothetical protein